VSAHGNTAPTEEVAKGFTLRGFLKTLESLEVFGRVRERVPAVTRAMMDDPPGLTAWVSGRVFQDIAEALFDLGGEPLVRAVGRGGVERGPQPIVISTVQGFLRLFGATPATLFARIGLIGTTLGQGASYDYAPVSDHEGVLTMTYDRRADASRPLMLMMAGACEQILAICGRRGTVEAPDITRTSHASIGRFRIYWDAR
jgi:hypothetical protein